MWEKMRRLEKVIDELRMRRSFARRRISQRILTWRIERKIAQYEYAYRLFRG